MKQLLLQEYQKLKNCIFIFISLPYTTLNYILAQSSQVVIHKINSVNYLESNKKEKEDTMFSKLFK